MMFHGFGWFFVPSKCVKRKTFVWFCVNQFQCGFHNAACCGNFFCSFRGIIHRHGTAIIQVHHTIYRCAVPVSVKLLRCYRLGRCLVLFVPGSFRKIMEWTTDWLVVCSEI
jgi:hypothetical protein